MASISPVQYALIPGAGSAGLTWTALADSLEASVLPLGDEGDVSLMAQTLLPFVADMRRPRVLVGGSLGAMVALEVARSIEVDALVLIAAGFGVFVSESSIRWVESNPSDLLEKMARLGLANPNDRSITDLRRADFEARGGQPSLLHHLRVLSAYKPAPFINPPITLVLWGPADRSVPLSDHAELALQLGGLLVPIDGSGHASFIEQPEKVARWVRASLNFSLNR